MKKEMVVFGFIFFAIELLAGSIYGLSLVPWDRVGGMITVNVLIVFFAILWNTIAALLLYLGYRD